MLGVGVGLGSSMHFLLFGLWLGEIDIGEVVEVRT